MMATPRGRVVRWGPTPILSLVLTILAAGCSSTAPKSNPGVVASVVVSPAKDTLLVGANAQLTAAAFDANNMLVPNQTFTWSSDMAAVASVSATGNVMALTSGGPVHIMAVDGHITGAAVIVDTAASVAVATVKVVPPTPSIAVGAMVQLTDTAKDAGGNVLPGRPVTWGTGNAAIASVSATGLVTGVAAGGPIMITATVGGKMGSAQVTVTPASTNLTYATISAGFLHTCALTSAGVAYCWGAGDQGELGEGSNTSFIYKPIMVTGGQTWALLRAAGNYTCALTAGGTPYCWGTGPRLGDNSTTGHNVPVLVSGGLAVDSLSGGNTTACILKSSGTLYCWGDNSTGELGINSTFSGVDSTPQAVDQGGLAFTAVSSRGDFHSCALVSTGAAYCWGNNTFGQLGRGASGADSVPVAVVGGLNFKSIATGGDHSCGIATTGTTYCWGSDEAGELGDGNQATFSFSPVVVSGGHAFTSVVSGSSFTCALTAAGAAWCWGYNTSGQIAQGNTTTTFYTTPTAVTGGLTFTSLTAGAQHVCGLVASGAAYCWGDNSAGELGTGTAVTPYTAPQLVSQP